MTRFPYRPKTPTSSKEMKWNDSILLLDFDDVTNLMKRIKGKEIELKLTHIHFE